MGGPNKENKVAILENKVIARIKSRAKLRLVEKLCLANADKLFLEGGDEDCSRIRESIKELMRVLLDQLE